MEIIPPADRRTSDGPADWFTGRVRIQPVDPPEANLVTFDAGARTAWHTHPHGQALFVVSGTARIGRDDGTSQDVGPGTIVRFEANERHWHGAAPGGEMSHLAVQLPGNDGNAADWGEHVTDAEYDSRT